jgi:hypothetical protein
VKRVLLPTKALVSPAAVERLQRKFAERKALQERERFWLKVQQSKQPGPIDLDAGLPIG